MTPPVAKNFYLSSGLRRSNSFRRLLASSRVKNLEEATRHLIHCNLLLVANWLEHCECSFTFFAHGLPTEIYEAYLSRRQAWRVAKVLRGIFEPSRESHRGRRPLRANIVKNFYPSLTIDVEPYYLTQSLRKTFRPEFAARGKLRVTFRSNMLDVKGAEYLLRFNEFIRQKSLPPGLVVLSSNIGAQAFREQKNSCGRGVNVTTANRGLNALKNFLRAGIKFGGG